MDHYNQAEIGSSISSQTYAAKEEVRQSHVDQQLSQLENTADRLQGVFDSLVGRISPVLHTPAPMPQPSGAAVDSVIAPLADRIRKVRNRLQMIEENMNSVYNSIEL